MTSTAIHQVHPCAVRRQPTQASIFPCELTFESAPAGPPPAGPPLSFNVSPSMDSRRGTGRDELDDGGSKSVSLLVAAAALGNGDVDDDPRNDPGG